MQQKKRPAPVVRRARPVWREDDQPGGAAEPGSEPSWRDDLTWLEEETAVADESGVEAPFDSDDDEEPPEIIATNTAVRLTCTLCAMSGLLAAFMCWAEKDSRAIRHFAVQSTAVSAAHLAVAALLLTAGALLSGVPYLGFVTDMAGWLIYFAVLVALTVVRARMMLSAWRGVRFTLPGTRRLLERWE